VAAGANGETPLLAARQLFFEGGDPDRAERIVRRLHRAGADVNARDAAGYTALITGAVNAKPNLVRLMLELGANPYVRSADGVTALGWARRLGQREVVEVLERAGVRE
jgi:ankyrin repeat protein